MERWERDARRDIPEGYAIVYSGPVQPDDMLFVWPAGGFDRADSDRWTFPVPSDAGDTMLCIRKARFDATEYRSQRTYTLRRELDKTTPPAALRTQTPEPQGSLF